MKKLAKTLALLALLANAGNALAVDVTMSPIQTAVDLVRAVLVTAVSPFASTTAVTYVSEYESKLEIAAVADDATNHLAGEEPTERLLNTIDYLRANIPELEDKSIEEIELTILAAVE